MHRLTSEEIKRIIRLSIDNNNTITPGFLKNALADRNLKQNDAETIAQMINADISKYKNRGNSDLPVHDDTIKDILSLINPPQQYENRLAPHGEKKYITRKKRLMTRIVENLKIQGDLNLAAKK